MKSLSEDKKLKNVLTLLVLFLMFLVYNLLVVPLSCDEVWNYGFSFSIYKGLIPYKDFNMVITPLFPFLMSLPFHIFGSHILIFHIENAFIITFICIFLFKVIGNKAWLIILFLFVPFSFSFPSYNVLSFFFLILLINLEVNKSNDYLIGIVLALQVLTKQSIGFFLLLPSLYYIKNYKKIIKRIIGFLIPICLFILYLLFTQSFGAFFDLCVMGLFDFFNENGNGFNIYHCLFIFILFITFFIIKKDKSNIINYYVIAFYSIILPIFDLYHLYFVVLAFFFLVVYYYDKKINLKLNLFVIAVVVGVLVIDISNHVREGAFYPNDIPYFEYRYLNKNMLSLTRKVNEFMQKNSNQKFVFLSDTAYYYRIINDESISYLDLINTGNWGYGGSDRLLKTIKENKNVIFVLDKKVSLSSQADKRALKYVKNQGTKIENIGNFDFYIVE